MKLRCRVLQRVSNKGEDLFVYILLRLCFPILLLQLLQSNDTNSYNNYTTNIDVCGQTIRHLRPVVIKIFRVGSSSLPSSSFFHLSIPESVTTVDTSRPKPPLAREEKERSREVSGL